MKFAYTYRSSDGQRHTAEIEAASRDAAFAKVRAELGIKPIKVVAAGSQDTHDNRAPHDRRRATVLGVLGVLGVLAALSLLAFGAWWWLAGDRGARDARPYQVMTPQGPVKYTVATPLPRQAIPGDRQRLEKALRSFKHSAERLLARFAEPGRKIEELKIEDLRLAREDTWRSCLREPIRVASSDFTEVVDLKRIVTGMKREMAAYIAGGGTAEQYIAELEKRQRLEISYRENAERRLGEMLSARPDAAPRQAGGRAEAHPSLKAAYAYWLKANAQLQAMGIYPLALPDALRAYQMGLDIEE